MTEAVSTPEVCLVERQDAHGRPNVEKAPAPAPFIAVFTANDVRREHLAQPEAHAAK